MVLVPATMALLGRRNWWLPPVLDRWLPHLDHHDDGAGPLPGAGDGPSAATLGHARQPVRSAG